MARKKRWIVIFASIILITCASYVFAFAFGFASFNQRQPLIAQFQRLQLSLKTESPTNNNADIISSFDTQKPVTARLITQLTWQGQPESRREMSWIPFIVHQTNKDLDLPAPYYMSLQGLLRHHLFRDPRVHPLTPTLNHSHVDGNDGLVGVIRLGSWSSIGERRNDSAVQKEPRFDYYLWTDASIAEYANERAARGDRPEFRIFKQLKLKLETADAIRYFALYEFGGVYMDLDIELVRPLTAFLERGYPCVLSEESPMQVGNQRVTNCFMLCRPKYSTV